MSATIDLPPFDPNGRCPYCGATDRQGYTHHPEGPAIAHLWDFVPDYEIASEDVRLRPGLLRTVKPCSVIDAIGEVLPNTIIQEHIQRHCGRCAGTWAERCWKDLPEQAWAALKREERHDDEF